MTSSNTQIDSFIINDGGSLDQAEPTNLSASWIDDPVRRWIDIQWASADEIREVLEPLKLHPLVLDCCLEPGMRSQVAPYEEALFIEFQLRHEWNDSVPTYISIICLPTTLLTLHSEPIPAISKLSHDLSSDACLVSATTSSLLYSLLDHFVDDSSRFALMARDEILRISVALDEDASSVDLSEVVAAKRCASQLAAMVGEQLYCITSMRTAKSKAIQIRDMHDYFRDLSDVAEKLHSSLNRLESRARDLYQDFVLALQEVTSSRLRILTVLSAVYLPATLIAGIYGMNFEHIPIIQIKHGYALVIGIMVALVVGQLAFFYRRGWFK